VPRRCMESFRAQRNSAIMLPLRRQILPDSAASPTPACGTPQATSHKPQATSHKPQATSHKPQASEFQSYTQYSSSHLFYTSIIQGSLCLECSMLCPLLGQQVIFPVLIQPRLPTFLFPPHLGSGVSVKIQSPLSRGENRIDSAVHNCVNVACRCKSEGCGPLVDLPHDIWPCDCALPSPKKGHIRRSFRNPAPLLLLLLGRCFGRCTLLGGLDKVEKGDVAVLVKVCLPE